MWRLSNLPAAALAFRMAMAKPKTTPVADAIISLGFAACLLSIPWAYSTGAINYDSYGSWKRNKEECEAEIQSIQARPNNEQNSSTESRLRSLATQRDSYAEKMKELKWTGKFARIFPPRPI